MRIGISTSVIQRGKTGVGQYVFALTRSLASLNTSHEFVLFVLKEDLPLFDFLDHQFEIVTVPENFRSPIKNILWHQTILPHLVRTHQLDVLHIPSYRRLLLPRPCARVATIHDLAPFHVSAKYDFLRMLYGRVAVKFLARRQDKIVAISENTARDIEIFFGIPRTKISVIYNGLDHARFFPGDRAYARLEVSQKHGMGDPFFLYVARLEHPGKNHVRLIDAFDQFKSTTPSPWQLVLGGSDWHGAEAIHARIKSSTFKSDIKCLGFVPDQNLPQLYRAAQAFVYPSLYEGFGLPPIEAMACGTPVICSDRGSLCEVVSDAAKIINPERVESLAAALAEFANNQDIRRDYVQRGLKRAQHFNWNTTATQMIEVFELAAQANARSRSITRETAVA
jgi:glycosyltransferase involved in cell wall biosynthesis